MKEVVERQMSVMYYINAYHQLELKFQENKISAYQFAMELANVVHKFQRMHRQEIDLAYTNGSLVNTDDITQKMLDDYYNLRH
jgi:hypothetical protein